MEYLETKDVQDRYTKNYKMTLIDFKETQINIYAMFTRLMLILPTLIQRFNTIPAKMPEELLLYLVDNSKFIWKCRGLKIAKTTLLKDKAGELTLPDLKTYSEVYIIKTVWYWHKAR